MTNPILNGSYKKDDQKEEKRFFFREKRRIARILHRMRMRTLDDWPPALSFRAREIDCLAMRRVLFFTVGVSWTLCRGERQGGKRNTLEPKIWFEFGSWSGCRTSANGSIQSPLCKMGLTDNASATL